MCKAGLHSYAENRVDILIPDQFTNTTQCYANEATKQVLFQGKNQIHKLDLN